MAKAKRESSEEWEFKQERCIAFIDTSKRIQSGSEKNGAFTVGIEQSQMQNTGFGNNDNPVGIIEIESILKKSVKAKLKLLGTMVSHSGGSGSL